MSRMLAFGLVLLAVFAVCGCTKETVDTVTAPEIRPAPELPGPGAQGADLAQKAVLGRKVGGFERPRGVPAYRILEKMNDSGDGARGVRLLVDTTARSEHDYGLIAQDLKARYAKYDVVSVEFTDTTRGFDYTGSALIFNTTRGAIYEGFVYGPPNNQGYIARAAK